MRLSLIKEQGECPPNGFRYVDPVDGFVAHAWTYNDWVQLQSTHMQVNDREVPKDLGLQMQDQLCQSLPPGWCNFDNPNRVRPNVSMGWNDVAAGVATFAKWIAGGAKYVDQSEADRRAEICSRCYLNVNVEGCGACHAAVAEVTKNVKTKFDHALRACGVCHCLLKAKVHFPIATLDTSGTNQQLYPDFCWMKKGGENYNA